MACCPSRINNSYGNAGRPKGLCGPRARSRAERHARRRLQPLRPLRKLPARPTPRASSPSVTRRRGAPASTSTARSRATWCASSLSKMRCTGSRNTTSTAYASTRCTPSSTTATGTSSTNWRSASAPPSPSARSISSLENEHNEASRLTRDATEALAYNAQWDDDIHHCWHRLLTGESESYYGDFRWRHGGAARPLPGGGLRLPGATISANLDRTRGREDDRVAARRLSSPFSRTTTRSAIARFGDRLTSLADPRRLALARAMLLLSPQVPMIFMGDEWGATTPIPVLRQLRGRGASAGHSRRPGSRVREVRFLQGRGQVRSRTPTALETFQASTLRWEERDREPHASVLARDKRAACPAAQGVGRAAGRQRFRRGLPYARHGTGGLEVIWRFDEGTLRFFANFDADPVSCALQPDETVLWQSGDLGQGRTVEIPAWEGLVTVNRSGSN